MKHYGLTTRSLGAQVGVGRSAISQIARGRLPRVDVAILIARAFDVTVNLNLGVGEDTVYTCDFSYDYVKINAEYTT